jgi:hypothetical protein
VVDGVVKKILILSANPKDTSKLRLDEEVAGLRDYQEINCLLIKSSKYLDKIKYIFVIA